MYVLVIASGFRVRRRCSEHRELVVDVADVGEVVRDAELNVGMRDEDGDQYKQSGTDCTDGDLVHPESDTVLGEFRTVRNTLLHKPPYQYLREEAARSPGRGCEGRGGSVDQALGAGR